MEWGLGSDLWLTQQINALAGRFTLMDRWMVGLGHNDLLNGAWLLALLYWGWFNERRRAVLGTLFGALAAVGIGRLIQHLLSFRTRPILDESVSIRLPFNAEQMVYDASSSFPSDHAVLYVALATGIFFLSRKLGWISLLCVALLTLFPRVYLGYHYVGDIVAGAALGALVTWMSVKWCLRTRWVTPIFKWCARDPGVFYALFFLLNFLITTRFEDLRWLCGMLFTCFINL